MNKIVKISKTRIENSLNKRFIYHHLATARSEKFLRQHDSKRLPMFVLYVDLVGSTNMSSNLEPEVFNRIIRMFSQEMAFVIEQFGGYVLKFVGDAVLGYFVANNSPRTIANKVIACAVTMQQVIKNAINPVLQSDLYPELKIKITIDFGECSIVRYGSDKKRSHIDLIGLTLNLAAKMQQQTKPEQIVIGEYVYEKLADKHKTCFRKIKTDDKEWRYHELGMNRAYIIFVNRTIK